MSRKKTCTDVLKILDTLPAGLTRLYDRILTEIDDDHAGDCALILEWVAFAIRPPTLAHLTVITGADKVDHRPLEPEQVIRDQIEWCGPLLNVKERNGNGGLDATVVLAHKTVKDHLVKLRGTQTRSEFAFHEEESHLKISKRCLDYFENELATAETTNSWFCLNKKQESKYPLMIYATFFWGEHARLAGDKALKLIESHPQYFVRSSTALVSYPNHFLEYSSQFRCWACSYRMCKTANAIWDVEMKDFTKDKWYFSPAHAVALFGILPLVHWFASKYPSDFVGLFTTKEAYGNTPLHLATQEGHTDVVKAILSYHVRFNDLTVFIAASDNRLDLLKFLVEQGGNVNVRGGDGSTALGDAAAQGLENIVRFLLEQGADVNIRYSLENILGRDPVPAVAYAAAWGRESVVRLLMPLTTNP